MNKFLRILKNHKYSLGILTMNLSMKECKNFAKYTGII